MAQILNKYLGFAAKNVQKLPNLVMLMVASGSNPFYKIDAAIAQRIRLHLPSCSQGFESPDHHLCIHQLLFKL